MDLILNYRKSYSHVPPKNHSISGFQGGHDCIIKMNIY